MGSPRRVRLSPAIVIQAARLRDVGAITGLYNAAIEAQTATFETEHRTEAKMRAWFRSHDARHPVLVALEVVPGARSSRREAVVGWASITSYRPRACYEGVGEFSLYVRKDRQGRGIGKALLLALIDEAKRLGYWKLLSRVFPFNEGSRALCRSCGFREVGVYEKHGKLGGRWLDTVIVERLIPENLTA